MNNHDDGQRIYFGRNHGNDPAMHESEVKEEIDIVLAVLTEAGFLEILAGTEANDIITIVRSAQDHVEDDLSDAGEGYERVSVIN